MTSFVLLNKMKQFSEDKEDLYSAVFAELKGLGVKVPKVKKFKSNVVKQEKIISETGNKVFGTRLCEQEWISESGYILPKFIASATTFLKSYTKVEIGLFRKAGSVARQRELRVRLENGGSLEGAEPNDVASLLKQWLRELPEPIIPTYLHDVFVRCQNLDLEGNRVVACLLSCLLLPPEHLYTLKHLVKFLNDIASNSNVNKMVPHNLAVIMAPNLLSTGSEKADRANNLVQCYTSLVELLIVNAVKVGEIPTSIALQLREQEGSLKFEESSDFSFEVLDSSPAKTKKKRKSGSVHELVNGFRKFVGSNLTPMSSRESPDVLHSRKAASVTRSTSKRKADLDLQSTNKKMKEAVSDSQQTNLSAAQCTPVGKTSRFWNPITTPVTKNSFASPASHVRRKSFGLLKRKNRKRTKPSPQLSVPAKKVSPNIEKSNISNNKMEHVQSKVELQREELISDKSSTTLDPNCTPFMDKLSPCIQTTFGSPFLTIDNNCMTRTKSDCPMRITGKQSKALDHTRSISHGSLPANSKKISPYQLKPASLVTRQSLRIKDHKRGKSPQLDKESNNHNTKETSQLSLSLPCENRELKRAGSVRQSSRKKDNARKVSRDSNATSLLTVKQPESANSEISSKPNLKREMKADNENFSIQRRNSRRHKKNVAQVKSLEGEKKDGFKSRSSTTSSSLNTNNYKSHSRPERHGEQKFSEHEAKDEKCLIKKGQDVENITHDTESNSDIPQKGSFKRSSQKSSLRRGRPNTINTGLPSELCPKYSTDSILSLKSEITPRNQSSNSESKVHSNGMHNYSQTSIAEDSVFTEIEAMDHERNSSINLSSAVIQNETTAGESASLEGCFSINVQPHDQIVADISAEDGHIDKSPSIVPLYTQLQSVSLIEVKNAKQSIDPSNENSHMQPSSRSLQTRSKRTTTSNCTKQAALPALLNVTNVLNISSEKCMEANTNESFNSDDQLSILSKIGSPGDLTSDNSKKKNKKPKKYRSSTNVNCLTPSPSLPMFKITKSEESSNEKEERTSPNDPASKTENNADVNWMPAEKYLSSHLTPIDGTANKRESIVQLMIKNAGKVQANVQHYNYIAKTPVSRTPTRIPRLVTASHSSPVQGNTPIYRDDDSIAETFASPFLNETAVVKKNLSSRCKFEQSQNEAKLALSEPRTGKSLTKSNKFRKSPIPMPPKFVITDMENLSPKLTKPLKEVTNRSNLKDDITQNKILRTSLSPSLTPKNNSVADLIQKPSRQSYTGRSPGKLSKACRSESSPAMKPRRQSQRIKNSTSKSPSPRSVKPLQSHSYSFSSPHCYKNSSIIRKTTSKPIVSVNNPMSDQMVDEWQCDM